QDARRVPPRQDRFGEPRARSRHGPYRPQRHLLRDVEVRWTLFLVWRTEGIRPLGRRKRARVVRRSPNRVGAPEAEVTLQRPGRERGAVEPAQIAGIGVVDRGGSRQYAIEPVIEAL